MSITSGINRCVITLPCFTVCKHYFHPKCVPAAANCLCDREPGLEARKRSKKTGRWKMHGTSEFTDREDKVITDAAEVTRLEDFIFSKVGSCLSSLPC